MDDFFKFNIQKKKLPGELSRYSNSLRDGRSGNRVQARGVGENFNIQSHITMVPGVFQGVKRPGRGVNYTPKFIARLKKECGYNFTPPLG